MDVGEIDGAGDRGNGLFGVGTVGWAQVEGGRVGAAIRAGIGRWHGGVREGSRARS